MKSSLSNLPEHGQCLHIGSGSVHWAQLCRKVHLARVIARRNSGENRVRGDCACRLPGFLSANDMNAHLVSVVCPHSGIDLNWAPDVPGTRCQRNAVKHLAETLIGRQSAVSRARITIESAMFRITHITTKRFSLAEILLMAAMNQIEAKRKVTPR